MFETCLLTCCEDRVHCKRVKITAVFQHKSGKNCTYVLGKYDSDDRLAKGKRRATSKTVFAFQELLTNIFAPTAGIEFDQRLGRPPRPPLLCTFLLRSSEVCSCLHYHRKPSGGVEEVQRRSHKVAHQPE